MGTESIDTPMADAVEVERPRCPEHDRPLLRLYYQRRVGGREGRLKTENAPWAICPDCERVFPHPV